MNKKRIRNVEVRNSISIIELLHACQKVYNNTQRPTGMIKKNLIRDHKLSSRSTSFNILDPRGLYLCLQKLKSQIKKHSRSKSCSDIGLLDDALFTR